MNELTVSYLINVQNSYPHAWRELTRVMRTYYGAPSDVPSELLASHAQELREELARWMDLDGLGNALPDAECLAWIEGNVIRNA
jgi:hypothetical protein